MNQLLEPAVLIPLIVAILAIAATYHIAIKSKSMARPKLDVLLGRHRLSARFRKPIAIIFGVPPSKKNDWFVFPIPVEIGGGSHPIDSIWVQFSYPKGRDFSRISHAFKTDESGAPKGGRRRVVDAAKRTFVEYEWDNVRADQYYCLNDFVVYHKSEINSISENPLSPLNLEEITISIRANNLKARKYSILFYTVWSNDLTELARAVGTVGFESRHHRKKNTITVTGCDLTKRQWTPPLIRFWRSRLLLCQTNFDYEKSEKGYAFAEEEGFEVQSVDFVPLRFIAEEVKPGT